jgi:PadR family transcriptional regulator, regulatory protein PadR
MAVGKLGDEAYGGSVVDLLQEALRRPIPYTQAYLALRRLEEKGLVTSEMGEPEAIRGGRRKRVFTLCGAGRKVLRDGERTLRTLRPAVFVSRLAESAGG